MSNQHLLTLAEALIGAHRERLLVNETDQQILCKTYALLMTSDVNVYIRPIINAMRLNRN